MRQSHCPRLGIFRLSRASCEFVLSSAIYSRMNSRMSQLRDLGDLGFVQMWKRVLAAVKEIQRQEAAGDRPDLEL